MVPHAHFTNDTCVSVLICGPHSRWQRASNEDANELLCDDFAEGPDFSALTQADRDGDADELIIGTGQNREGPMPAEECAQNTAFALSG